MPAVCPRCHRVNPPDASYCYNDGQILPGHAGQTLAARFPTAFQFPSGMPAWDFDSLVLGCESDWKTALELLRHRAFEQFFTVVGRPDLAQAAQQAAQAPDLERSLHQFLSRLPSTKRLPAALHVEPVDVPLGRLPRGTEGKFILSLQNQGMGLLSGSVSADETPWLVPGESTSAKETVFQCRYGTQITVQVRGKAFRAAPQPQVGRLLVESNGGTVVVNVHVDVPVQPYPDGVLAGAVTPRQLAEKAQKAPREAVPLFEQGRVAAWYEANGWTYPVQGPETTGMSCLQQFFEALGLVRPPKLEISTTSVALQGLPGAVLEQALELRTSEQRNVYAQASTDVAWLQAGPCVGSGQVIQVPLRVPAVPSQPGEQLQGRVKVVGNGKQEFVVAVTLAVGGVRPYAVQAAPVRVAPAPSAPVPQSPPPIPVAAQPARKPAPVVAPAQSPPPPPVPWPAPPPAASVVASVPVLAPAPWEAQSPVTAPPSAAVSPVLPRPVSIAAEPPANLSPPGAVPDRRRGALAWTKHLVPLAVVVVAFLGVVARDFRMPPKPIPVPEPECEEVAEEPRLLDPTPLLGINFHSRVIRDDRIRGIRGDQHLLQLIDVDPNLNLNIVTMRFGLEMLREEDPKAKGTLKRLNYDRWGRSNGTCVRIDGAQLMFGPDNPRAARELSRPSVPTGQWAPQEETLGKDETGREREGRLSTWRYDKSNVEVTQIAEIVPGKQSRRLDTCQIVYVLKNTDAMAHRVGIRFLLDNYGSIGASAGVTFFIPGSQSLINTSKEFAKNKPNVPEVPAYVEAYERESLENPGTVARVQFGFGSRVETPTRVTLGAWPLPMMIKRFPGSWGGWTGWEVPLIGMKDVTDSNGKAMPADSCVAIYWDDQVLEPGASRTVGFTYGLSKVANSEAKGKLLLTVSPARKDEVFTMTALVKKPESGEKVTLTLPKSIALVNCTAERLVPIPPADAPSQVSTVEWTLRSKCAGKFALVVSSSSGAIQNWPVYVSKPPPPARDPVKNVGLLD